MWFFFASFHFVFCKNTAPKNAVRVLCFALFKTETIETISTLFCETKNETNEAAHAKVRYE